MIRRFVFFIFTLASVGCATAQQALPAPPLVTPQPVIPYPTGVNYIDYRPAINGPDTRIVFERQLYGSPGPANLYVTALAQPNPVPFLTNPPPSGTTRPDWCYVPGRPNYDGPIVYTEGENGPIFIKSSQPGPAGASIPNTSNSIYPTWYPGCTSLAIYSQKALATPSSSPQQTEPALLGISTKNGLPARFLTGRSLWAGFASINTASPFLIAFAGQPFGLTPNKECTKTGYQQDCNYIYVGADSSAGVQVHPLDRDAPTNIYDPDHQGRAPTWSPDGRWIAFESNRICRETYGLAYYAIYVQDSLHATAARQVTDCSWNAQHAKWYHHQHAGRTLLIVTVLRYPTPKPSKPTYNTDVALPRTISNLDVTAFVR